jgi:tetratricopeptide (TPR) repeat protein
MIGLIFQFERVRRNSRPNGETATIISFTGAISFSIRVGKAGTQPQVLQQAVDLHLKGRLAEAEGLYLQLLNAQSDHFDALHMLGVLRYQQGQYAQSLGLIGAALKTNPNSPPAIVNYALVLAALNRPAEALSFYDKALAIEPNYALAHHGAALAKLNRPSEALESCDRALTIRPDYAEAHNTRGVVLRALKRPAEALASFDKAVALKPTYAEAFNNRGNALTDLKSADEALASYDKAILLKPDYAEAFANRAGRSPTSIDSTKRLLVSTKPSPSSRTIRKRLATEATVLVNSANWTRPHCNFGKLWRSSPTMPKRASILD